MTDREILEKILEKTEGLEVRVGNLEETVSAQSKQMDSMKLELRAIHLTMENELNRSIQLVAEGHLDLNRKLNEVLQRNGELEMMQVRISLLETRLKDVQTQLAAMA